MQYKSILASFIAGLALGYYLFFSKKDTPIVTQNDTNQEKIVTKYEVITRPDGTKEEKKVIVEDRKSEKIVAVPPAAKKDYRVGVLYGLDEKYTGTVSRRMLGDIWLDAYATSKREIGIGISVEF